MSELITCLNQLNKARDDYEAKFGKNSLNNRVPYYDPLNPDLANVKNGIKILNKAIQDNRPLPEWNPPDDLVF